MFLAIKQTLAYSRSLLDRLIERGQGRIFYRSLIWPPGDTVFLLPSGVCKGGTYAHLPSAQ